MNTILKQNEHDYVFVDFVDIIKGGLPLGYYNLEFDNNGNPFLHQTADLKLPSIIHDTNILFRKRILTSFNYYDDNLGVLLSGQSGTGKSIDAKLIAKEVNLPVILITKAINKKFNLSSFINNINFSCVLFFDEFEKNFSDYEDTDSEFLSQETLLSVLDGVNSSIKKLFLFTVNGDVNKFLKNRPSRIKYFKTYEGLSEELVKIICEKELNNKDYIEDLIKNVNKENCTIDILRSIIKEVNVLNEPFSNFVNDFNYKQDDLHATLFKIEKKKEIFIRNLSPNHLDDRDGDSLYISGVGTMQLINKEKNIYETSDSQKYRIEIKSSQYII